MFAQPHGCFRICDHVTRATMTSPRGSSPLLFTSLPSSQVAQTLSFIYPPSIPLRLRSFLSLSFMYVIFVSKVVVSYFCVCLHRLPGLLSGPRCGRSDLRHCSSRSVSSLLRVGVWSVHLCVGSVHSPFDM